MAGEETTIEAQVGDAGIKVRSARMSDIIALGCICVTVFGAVVLYQHHALTESAMGQLQAVLKELAAAQREMTCIMSLPQEKREQQYLSQDSFCKRMARMQ